MFAYPDKERFIYVINFSLHYVGDRHNFHHLLCLYLSSMLVNLLLLGFEECDLAWVHLLLGALIFDLPEISKHSLVHYVADNDAKYSFRQLEDVLSLI